MSRTPVAVQVMSVPSFVNCKASEGFRVRGRDWGYWYVGRFGNDEKN